MIGPLLTAVATLFKRETMPTGWVLTVAVEAFIVGVCSFYVLNIQLCMGLMQQCYTFVRPLLIMANTLLPLLATVAIMWWLRQFIDFWTGMLVAIVGPLAFFIAFQLVLWSLWNLVS